MMLYCPPNDRGNSQPTPVFKTLNACTLQSSHTL